jgi:hypothetical protein
LDKAIVLNRQNLFFRPRLRHVLDAQFALVAHEREMQLVTHSIELIGGWLLAGFRSLPAQFVNCEIVAGYSVLTRYIWVTALVEIDLERSVRIQRPHATERVRPRASECSRTGCGSSRAGTHERDQRARENNSERVL